MSRQNQQCPICDDNSGHYKTIDGATDFEFCNDCFKEVQSKFRDQENNFSNWLRSIADVRDDYHILDFNETITN